MQYFGAEIAYLCILKYVSKGILSIDIWQSILRYFRKYLKIPVKVS